MLEKEFRAGSWSAPYDTVPRVFITGFTDYKPTHIPTKQTPAVAAVGARV
jgi:hypothetical protein